ncbi:MAG TPA: hypothetical protein VHS74_06875, partial [Solirubrobacterales bacterium]|nr:hypothetical protein [Solirubrobacterales bacterium]
GRVEKRFYSGLLKTAGEFTRVPPQLDALGFAEGVTIRKYLRDAHPPRFPAPGGVEVVEVEGSDSPFGEIVALGSDRPAWTASVFAHLPGRQGWRCYLALVEGTAMAAAAMLVDGKVAQFGLGGSVETAREGCQLALLRRRIEDAIALGVRQFAADVEVGDDDNSVAGRRDLRDAGFRPAYDRDAWVD